MLTRVIRILLTVQGTHESRLRGCIQDIPYRRARGMTIIQIRQYAHIRRS